MSPPPRGLIPQPLPKQGPELQRRAGLGCLDPGQKPRPARLAHLGKMRAQHRQRQPPALGQQIAIEVEHPGPCIGRPVTDPSGGCADPVAQGGKSSPGRRRVDLQVEPVRRAPADPVADGAVGKSRQRLDRRVEEVVLAAGDVDELGALSCRGRDRRPGLGAKRRAGHQHHAADRSLGRQRHRLERQPRAHRMGDDMHHAPPRRDPRDEPRQGTGGAPALGPGAPDAAPGAPAEADQERLGRPPPEPQLLRPGGEAAAGRGAPPAKEVGMGRGCGPGGVVRVAMHHHDRRCRGGQRRQRRVQIGPGRQISVARDIYSQKRHALLLGGPTPVLARRVAPGLLRPRDRGVKPA